MKEIEPIVTMRAANKRFGRITAMDAIDLAISPGHIVGLLGANGAGKSTLLRMMIGLYLPDSGKCTTFGREARLLGPKELARIGYVHQEGELLEWMTTRQLIRYVSTYYPTWNHELEETYIKDFEIDLRAKVGKLSPGQRQKLAILLAIGFEPELLILDEPASALDPIARGQFLDLLLSIIQNENRTIIISSHILSDVEKVIDHTLIMKGGRMVRDCSFDELKEEFTRIRITSIAGELPQSLPFAEIIDCKRNHSSAIVTLAHAKMSEIQEQAAGMQCHLEAESLSLEEIYKLVVKG